MKTRALRPPVQVGLSLPCVRRRRKRPGFEHFKRFRSITSIAATLPSEKGTDEK